MRKTLVKSHLSEEGRGVWSGLALCLLVLTAALNNARTAVVKYAQ